jgi:hypothetical protein
MNLFSTTTNLTNISSGAQTKNKRREAREAEGKDPKIRQEEDDQCFGNKA